MSRVRLYGLAIDSEIALPDLPGDTGASPADLRIVIGKVPAARRMLERHGERVLLSIAGAARFLVGTSEIVVETEDGADPRDVRTFLLGSAMGLNLLLRGQIALHANAVVVDGRAWLFCGPSGSGKSTLAAWFARAGYDVLADDVAAILWSQGRPYALAGPPRVRLWDDAIRAAGDDPECHPLSFPSHSDVDKRDVRLTVPPAEKVPLGAIIFLEEGDLGCSALHGTDAAASIIENIYRGGWLSFCRREAPVLSAAAQLATAVPVLRLRRPFDHDRIGEALPVLAKAVGA